MNSDAASTPFFTVLAYAPVQDQASGPAARVPGLGSDPAGGDAQPLTGDGSTTAPGTGAQQPVARGPDMMFFILIGVFAFMIISMMLSGRKQRRQMQDMLSSLSRGDTVQTSAGIIGVIGEIRDDIIVLKIDESNHTKMRVTKTSISRVVKPAHERAANADNSEVEAA